MSAKNRALPPALDRKEEKKDASESQFRIPQLSSRRPTRDTPCEWWNRGQYLDRVKSFTPVWWFNKPSEINALRCARFGWRCVGIDTLRCSGCATKLKFVARKTSSENTVRMVAKRFREQLESCHLEKCVWRERPCDETFEVLPVDRGDLRDHLVTVLQSWAQRDARHRRVHVTVSNDAKETMMKALRVFAKSQVFVQGFAERPAIVQDTVFIAASGWTLKPFLTSPGSQAIAATSAPYVHCRYCNRTVCLSMFRFRRVADFLPYQVCVATDANPTSPESVSEDAEENKELLPLIHRVHNLHVYPTPALQRQPSFHTFTSAFAADSFVGRRHRNTKLLSPTNSTFRSGLEHGFGPCYQWPRRSYLSEDESRDSGSLGVLGDASMRVARKRRRRDAADEEESAGPKRVRLFQEASNEKHQCEQDAYDVRKEKEEEDQKQHEETKEEQGREEETDEENVKITSRGVQKRKRDESDSEMGDVKRKRVSQDFKQELRDEPPKLEASIEWQSVSTPLPVAASAAGTGSVGRLRRPEKRRLDESEDSVAELRKSPVERDSEWMRRFDPLSSHMCDCPLVTKHPYTGVSGEERNGWEHCLSALPRLWDDLVVALPAGAALEPRSGKT